MTIQQASNNINGEFFILIEDKKLASLTYSYNGLEKIIINHTEVDKALKGQGIGYKLIESVVEYARENDIKIESLCTFASAVFKKREGYSDVLNS